MADATNNQNIALLGYGYWGRNLARNLYELGVLSAVVEPNPDARAEVENKFPGLKTFADTDAVWSDPSIEGVVLATPAVTHHALALEALQCGKDVFVEKPLALTVREGVELVEEARRQEAILMVGHLLEYHPAVTEIERCVEAGEIGALRYIYSNRLNWGRLRKEENILWSFAPHDISVILRLVGQSPSRVRAMGGDWVTPGVHDVTVTHLEFPGGVRCHIFVSWLHPHKEQRLVVTGDKSVMVFEDSAPEPERKLRKYAHRVEWVERAPVAHKAPEQLVEIPVSEPLKVECQAFIDAMQTREEPRTSGRRALEVLRVLEASQKSLAAGSSWIELDAGPEGEMKPFVHESAVIDEGVSLGKGTKVWHHAHVSTGAQVGANCVLGQNVFIAPNVAIGQGVRVQNNVSVYAGVVLEDEVFVGPSAVFTNIKTPRSHVDRKEEFVETRIGHRATIGANATIVCGVSVGHHALVGAGAVVTHDVAPHRIVHGNPAREKGWACDCGEVLSEELACVRCGNRYQEREEGLALL